METRNIISYLLISFKILTLCQSTPIKAFLGGLSSARIAKSLDEDNEEEEDEDTGCLKTFSTDVKCYGDVLVMLLENCPSSNEIPQVSLEHYTAIVNNLDLVPMTPR